MTTVVRRSRIVAVTKTLDVMGLELPEHRVPCVTLIVMLLTAPDRPLLQWLQSVEGQNVVNAIGSGDVSFYLSHFVYELHTSAEVKFERESLHVRTMLDNAVIERWTGDFNPAINNYSSENIWSALVAGLMMTRGQVDT